MKKRNLEFDDILGNCIKKINTLSIIETMIWNIENTKSKNLKVNFKFSLMTVRLNY